jgi:hypothetical protein
MLDAMRHTMSSWMKFSEGAQIAFKTNQMKRNLSCDSREILLFFSVLDFDSSSRCCSPQNTEEDNVVIHSLSSCFPHGEKRKAHETCYDLFLCQKRKRKEQRYKTDTGMHRFCYIDQPSRRQQTHLIAFSDKKRSTRGRAPQESGSASR